MEWPDAPQGTIIRLKFNKPFPNSWEVFVPPIILQLKYIHPNNKRKGQKQKLDGAIVKRRSNNKILNKLKMNCKTYKLKQRVLLVNVAISKRTKKVLFFFQNKDFATKLGMVLMKSHPKTLFINASQSFLNSYVPVFEPEGFGFLLRVYHIQVVDLQLAFGGKQHVLRRSRLSYPSLQIPI